MLGHSDTVYPRGTAAQRPLRLVDDRLMGPGTCDMKAGLLGGIYAIEALQQMEFNDFSCLAFLCVADEEVDQRSSIPLIRETMRGCDAVLTLEAARENGDIVTARKGNIVLRVQAQGKSAHAGVEPEKGRNAITGLLRRLLHVEALAQPQQGITINIGVIEGGTMPNVVPDLARAAVDIRAYSQTELDRTVAAIQDIFAVTEPDGIEFTTSIRCHIAAYAAHSCRGPPGAIGSARRSFTWLRLARCQYRWRGRQRLCRGGKCAGAGWTWVPLAVWIMDPKSIS